MIRTQVQLEESQVQWLRATARDEGVSMSQLVRDNISFFQKQKNKATDKKSLQAVGSFASGKPDTARNHDKYLTEIYENKPTFVDTSAFYVIIDRSDATHKETARI